MSNIPFERGLTKCRSSHFLLLPREKERKYFNNNNSYLELEQGLKHEEITHVIETLPAVAHADDVVVKT